MSTTPHPAGSPGDPGSPSTGDRRTRGETGTTARTTGADGRDPARRGESNTTGWISLLVAVALLGLQVYYALNSSAIDGGGQQGYRPVITFTSLVLGLAGAVLALVGLAQRRLPRWPSVVGLSIGVYAFVIAVFSWIGGLMDASA